MLSGKTYLRILFSILGIVLATAILYAEYFSKYYPPPVTERVSFDAKIKFIRDHINPDEIDTIVVGSSIGLNNVRGVYLEKSAKKCKKVLNLSVYEASPVQVEQLLSLTDAFPNLKRIIYSAQFSDFQHASKFKNYDPEFLMKYMRRELNPIAYVRAKFRFCKDLSFCVNRQKEWAQKHGMNNKFFYLGFDASGSVPLHIYGKDIVMHRWKNPHGSRHVQTAFNALDRMTKRAHNKGIKFYFVQQPYRQELIKKYAYVQSEMDRFLKLTKDIMLKNGEHFLSLYKELHLDDTYFADRSHLNDRGSIIGSHTIGKFIDKSEK